MPIQRISPQATAGFVKTRQGVGGLAEQLSPDRAIMPTRTSTELSEPTAHS